VGGGGIFFGVSRDVPRWINDKDESLIEVYKALRDRPVPFMAACRQNKPLEPGEGPERLQAVFDEFLKDRDMDAALRYYFLNRTSWGGIPSRIHKIPFCQNPRGWQIVRGDRLWRAAGLLQGEKLTAGDYLPLLRAPGEDVWIYCDPCYYFNNELPKSSWLYRHIFTEEQHALFAAHVKACPHKVLVSYDDHPFIRSLYANPTFRIFVTDPIRYQLKGKQTHELLIANH
jgi:DNA adenine methylase